MPVEKQVPMLHVHDIRRPEERIASPCTSSAPEPRPEPENIEQMRQPDTTASKEIREHVQAPADLPVEQKEEKTKQKSESLMVTPVKNIRGRPYVGESIDPLKLKGVVKKPIRVERYLKKRRHFVPTLKVIPEETEEEIIAFEKAEPPKVAHVEDTIEAHVKDTVQVPMEDTVENLLSTTDIRDFAYEHLATHKRVIKEEKPKSRRSKMLDFIHRKLTFKRKKTEED